MSFINSFNRVQRDTEVGGGRTGVPDVFSKLLLLPRHFPFPLLQVEIQAHEALRSNGVYM